MSAPVGTKLHVGEYTFERMSQRWIGYREGYAAFPAAFPFCDVLDALAAAHDAMRTAHAALRVSASPADEEGYSGRVRSRARAAIEATGCYSGAYTSAGAP